MKMGFFPCCEGVAGDCPNPILIALALALVILNVLLSIPLNRSICYASPFFDWKGGDPASVSDKDRKKSFISLPERRLDKSSNKPLPCLSSGQTIGSRRSVRHKEEIPSFCYFQTGGSALGALDARSYERAGGYGACEEVINPRKKSCLYH